MNGSAPDSGTGAFDEYSIDIKFYLEHEVSGPERQPSDQVDLLGGGPISASKPCYAVVLINFSIFVTAEVAVALHQIMPAFDGPSPKPIHTEWRDGPNVVVDQIPTLGENFCWQAQSAIPVLTSFVVSNNLKRKRIQFRP